jgi:hypothetical protein
MDQQRIIRQAAGLWSHPNRYSLPPGALWKADNCVIYREGVVSKRRGFSRYGDALSNAPSDVWLFDQSLIVQDGTTLRYDSDDAGTWAAWTGTYSPPDASSPIRTLEARKTFYFTTSGGVYSNDEKTGTPRLAGMAQGLDTQLAYAGTGASWFTSDTQVGYRVVWLRKDANNREIRGAPSYQEILTNPRTTGLSYTSVGAGPYTVTVTHTSHGFSDSDSIDITNSSDPAIADGAYTITYINANSYSFSVAADPGAGTLDDGKARDITLTATMPDDVVAGDSYEVYRSLVSSGIAVTPADRHFLVAKTAVVSGDVTNGYVTYSDTLDEAFLGVGLYVNDTLEGPSATKSATNDRPPWCRFLATYQGHTFYAYTLHPQQLSLKFLDVAGLTDETSAITLTGATTETYTFSAAEDLPNNKFKRWTTYATVSQNVAATMKSMCKVINRKSATYYAWYVSGTTQAPGMIVIKNRLPNVAAFSATADAAGTGDNFDPILPTSGTTIISEAETGKNILFRSKFEQPQDGRRVYPDGAD